MIQKLKLLSVSVSLACGLTAFAAPELGRSNETLATGGTPLLLGFQGGMSAANLDTPSNVTSNGNLGFLAGLNVQVRLSEMFSIQPEANFSRRGYSIGDGAGVNVNAKSDSIEVPVLARVNFGTKVVPYLFAGPMAVFNVSNSVGANAGDTSIGEVGYNPRTVDLAATVGAGLQYQAFFLNVRYSLGLLGADDGQANYASRGFQLLAGFNLGV